MSEEQQQLLKQFLRKWSTIELDETARRALKEDAKQLIALLEILEADTDLVEEAIHAPDRAWFATRFRKLFV